jgi:hypothetical protein
MWRRQFIVFLAAVLGETALRSPTAQAQDKPASAPAPNNQIGGVATLQGSATVTRNNAAPAALKVNDAIFKHDTLETGDKASLGITFDDETTFRLSANARIAVDEFVYQQGAKGNSALFNIARGTVAFVAAKVAKTGDMSIATPTASLGIRGTTGVVEVPADAAGGEATVKLYPDADGHVGQIRVFNRQGGELGVLTRAASAFSLRGGLGGQLVAVPIRLTAQMIASDRGIVRQLFNTHNIGLRQLNQRLRSLTPNLRKLDDLRKRGTRQLDRNLRGLGEPKRGGLRDTLKKLNPFSRD